MAHREHEAVAVGPDGILGIEAQMALPQRVGHRRHGHGRPGMPRVGLLDRVHRQRPYGVDTEGVEIGRRQHLTPLGAARRRSSGIPEHSGRAHEIVQIDISFTCRRFDRPIASDPSGTIDAPHARMHDCNCGSEPLHVSQGSLREDPKRATGQTTTKVSILCRTQWTNRCR